MIVVASCYVIVSRAGHISCGCRYYLLVIVVTVASGSVSGMAIGDGSG